MVTLGARTSYAVPDGACTLPSLHNRIGRPATWGQRRVPGESALGRWGPWAIAAALAGTVMFFVSRELTYRNADLASVESPPAVSDEDVLDELGDVFGHLPDAAEFDDEFDDEFHVEFDIKFHIELVVKLDV